VLRQSVSVSLSFSLSVAPGTADVGLLVNSSLLSTLLLTKDGTILYRNILLIQTDFVNCSYKYLLNAGLRFCECVKNAVND